MNKIKRICKICGLPLPPFNHYQTDWCWMCCRATCEREYSRYYVKTETENGLVLYEEVQSLRGICPFNKKDQSFIQTIIEKERKILKRRILTRENEQKCIT